VLATISNHTYTRLLLVLFDGVILLLSGLYVSEKEEEEEEE
jgi:hypothetical protein